jgi:hypothetical protein
MIRLGLRFTSSGRLLCEPVDDAPGLDDAMAARLGEAFARGSGDGLLRLGAGEVGQALPPVFVSWRDFASRYVAALCIHAASAEGGQADASVPPEVPTPDEAELASLVLTAPMMPGAEYLTPEVRKRCPAEWLTEAERIERGYLGSLLPLTLLAPDIVEGVLDGRQPEAVTLPRLLQPHPAPWAEQRVAVGQ